MVQHEVKYSNGTFEISVQEEERDRRDETTRDGFTDYIVCAGTSLSVYSSI